MRALVAIDGFDSGLHAAQQARALLPSGTTLILAAVVAPPIDPNEGAGGFAGPTITPQDAERQHAGDVVAADAALAEVARALGPEPIEQRVVVGTPADALAALAAEQQIDLLVVGAHGHGIVSRALHVATDDSILRASPVSVMLVPPPHA